MKGSIRFIAVLAVGMLVLAGCSAFTFSTSDLKNKTLTYSSNAISSLLYSALGRGSNYTPNGHDKTTLTFDATGTAGKVEFDMYAYNFTTAAAYTGGVYTDKAWFQYNGGKGSFTYDPDTGALSLTIAEIYGYKSGATPTGAVSPTDDYLYASTDYEWQTVAVNASIQDGVTYSDASMAVSFTGKVTEDGIYSVYVQSGSDATSWVCNATSTASYTLSGVATSKQYAFTTTYTITDGSLVLDMKDVETTTSGSTTTTDTSESIDTYSIINTYLVGESDSDSDTFNDKWKSGNTVTFQAEETEYDEISYYGDTAPTAPDVDETTGYGSNSGTDANGNSYSYSIDKGVDATATFNLTHEGTYIMDTTQTSTASRHIHTK